MVKFSDNLKKKCIRMKSILFKAFRVEISNREIVLFLIIFMVKISNKNVSLLIFFILYYLNCLHLFYSEP